MLQKYNAVRNEFDQKAMDYEKKHINQFTTMGLHEMIRRHRLKQIVNKDSGKLLSIGCGTGWCLKHFSEQGLQCFGMDISGGMLMQCRKDNLNVCLADSEKIPFKDETFDIVVCINVFQYIENPFIFLEEVKRIAQKNGLFVFDFKNLFSLRVFMHYFFKIFREKHESDKEHRCLPFKIRQLIQSTDFKTIHTIGMEFDVLPINRKLYPKKIINFFKKIDYLLGITLLKYFSGRIMISVEKR
jgi:ubiquinone/menaquinone biosynthesis C-methylase UbiE